MREYLLAWRALPKLAIGAAFMVELLLIFLGDEILLDAASSAFKRLGVHFEGATLLIAVVLLLAFGASLGLFLLNAISAVVRTIGRILAGIAPSALTRRSLPLRELFESPYATAMKLLAGPNGQFYVDVYAKKSSSYSLEALEKSQLIEAHFSSARTLVTQGQVVDVESVVFQGALAQERRTFEIILDECQVFENLAIVLALVPVALLATGLNIWPIIGLGALLLTLSAGLLPEIAYRKRFLAGYILATALELFAVNEGADVADREGEPFA